MQSKISILIIIIAVSAILYFMVSVVKDFNEASVVKSSNQVSAKDSITTSHIDSLYQRDSVLMDIIQQQNLKLEDISKQLSNIKYKLSVVSSSLSAE